MAGREGEGERKTSKRGRTLKRIVRKLLDCVVPWLCFISSPTHILLLRAYAELARVNLVLGFKSTTMWPETKTAANKIDKGGACVLDSESVGVCHLNVWE